MQRCRRYFACPTRRVVHAAAARGAKAYRYLWTAEFADLTAALGLPAWSKPLVDLYIRPWLGSFHGSNEILFWAVANDTRSFTPAEHALGRRLVSYWCSFAKGGAPSATWPASTGGAADQEPLMVLGAGQDSLAHGWHAQKCDLLDSLGRFVWDPPTYSGKPSA